ncbi:hydantoinase B/oxoprolinase family protein [Acanthopleuribacter pedis]|uniref:Hydantoinase B/oxoprolinase family protein n=1 Tax=Acanthopleuribacter pedis TaxID=442870 RepID=A0A8J7U545_9BACT|nr:hydantoinase B/oxoprolinase family protein [Acanthopleuribacter pedis]MBO1320459.1 hydantoinase B/oxoprolinase family protein [Acanthopleuribacter pedis]
MSHASNPSSDSPTAWQFWIDRGGTFTDIVARRPDGSLSAHKFLSEHPERYRDAALFGMRSLLQSAPAKHRNGEPNLSQACVEAVKMGTTVATNALLERKGAKTLFVVTEGFGDVLHIGSQHRRDIFARKIEKPVPLFSRVVEVRERISVDGMALFPLDEDHARAALQQAFDDGFEAVAVALVHGYRHPAHERRLGALAAAVGFTQVSLSHQVTGLIRLVHRADTTVADAYLSPVLRRYVAQVQAETGDIPLLFMQSNGGLIAADAFQGKNSVLSGPAGGIVGAVATAEQAGFPRVITFDMGGTSTDVAHYSGDLERAYNREVAGIRLQAPMMDIHTVAAGGGSILSFDGLRFQVGPASAGADPGPAAYGRGGPATVTDANLILGRLVPACFPKVFGPNGDLGLDSEAALARFQTLADQSTAATGNATTAVDVAEGCLRLAVAGMADAVKKISLQQGRDVAGYALQCFGGAGGQLACRVAAELGMRTVLVHPFAGVLSAYGMGLADVRVLESRTVEQPLTERMWPELNELASQLKTQTVATLEAPKHATPSFHVSLQVKYEGSDEALRVPFESVAQATEAFVARHRARYGFVLEGKTLLVASLEVEARLAENTLNQLPTMPSVFVDGPPPEHHMWLDGVRTAVPVYDWAALEPGQAIDGPAVIVNPLTAVTVDPGWRARHEQCLMVERVGTQVAGGGDDPNAVAVDPVRLEIFNNLYMSIAEQMGFVLQNTSVSVNIKERLDFSCAVFDGNGFLIANAPHMPVHLGSMGESVQALIQRHREEQRLFAPGDVYAINDPYNGGTHLPDITVVSPVFDRAGAELLFFVASRGHHADVGGKTPGSMPPFSRSIEEEGVLFDMVPLVENGAWREEALLALLSSGPYPARNPAQNMADLRAQAAANHKGAEELRKLVDRYGRAVVIAYMQHVQDYAETCVRRVIGVLKSGAFRYTCDSGSVVAVQVTTDPEQGTAVVDFTGTSPQQDDNFNAPAAVTKAAVLYVFRCLVEENIPLNAGCLKPLTIHIPEGSMLAPRFPAAVVAGNVETSQVVTDALFGALGVQAAAQGTMNNFTFGNATRQYYETICGGAGAGDGYDGADAVQTHMTNSRITDVEVLELRFPVLLERFAIRRGSGGAGRFRGGDGVVRRVRFLAAMTAAILANRREVPPFGLGGGQSGRAGRTRWWRITGAVDTLPSCAEIAVAPGDVLEIETPGGGGFGDAANEKAR